jgi:hypothetical protein
MSKLHLYMVRYNDGYEEMLFAPDEEMKRPGAAEAFEIELREKATWFYPLGEIESRPTKRGDSLDIKSIKALVDAWNERGAPKITGAGAGASPFGSQNNDAGTQ